MQGKIIHSESLRIQNGYYTKDLSMADRADGVYLVVIETESERINKKFVVNWSELLTWMTLLFELKVECWKLKVECFYTMMISDLYRERLLVKSA